MTTTTTTTSRSGTRLASVLRSQAGRSPQERRNTFWGLVFTAPAIIGLLWFTAYPVLVSIYYSFTSTTMVKPPQWIGLDNYISLAGDKSWWTSLGNTLYYLIVSVPLG